MEILNYNITDLVQIGTDLGNSEVTIPRKMVEDLCKYHKLPTTLLGIDAKYGLNTTLELLQKQVKDIDVLVDDNGKALSVLDPKSTFVTDEEFDEKVEDLKLLCDFEKDDTRLVGAEKKVTLSFPIAKENDSFIGDLFQKRLDIVRLPQGGVAMNLGLLRLICTNGCMTMDKEYNHMSRRGMFSIEGLQQFANLLGGVNLQTYFENLWTKDGEMLEASVSDFLGMKRTLTQITDKDIADYYFNAEPIEDHYLQQNVDIYKVNDKLRSRMPSGMTYYDAFNVLTNAVKQAPDSTLQDRIQVASWAKPSRLLQLKQSAISYHGRPYYSEQRIAHLKGDQ